MRFCSKKALNQLVRRGVVASMRDYQYKKDRIVMIKGCDGRVIGKGVIVDVRNVSEKNLRELVIYSGFDSMEEWIEEAVRLHKKLPRFIVLLRML